MKIKDILKENQPEIYKKLCEVKNDTQKINNKNRQQTILTKNYERLMQHSSYKRHRGAIRQVR